MGLGRAFRPSFSCYSRNFTSVTFSLQAGQLPLFFSYETTPYRETYESSSSEKTAHQNRRGGERSAEVCWISRLVRHRAGVRTDLRQPARNFHVAGRRSYPFGKPFRSKFV